MVRGFNPLVDPRLEAFAAFARHLHFANAAEELGMNQPALHVKIAQLQKTLQARLYVVEKKRVVGLTAAGEALAKHAADARRLADDTYLSISGGHIGPLVIAAGRGAFLYVASDAIEALSGREGGLHIVHAGNTEAIDAVRSGTADLGIVANAAIPPGLASEPLANYRQMLIVKDRHRLAKRKAVAIKDFDGLGLALPGQGEQMRDTLDRAFAANDVRITVEAEALNWDLLIKFVQFGVAATVVNECVPLPEGITALPITDAEAVTYNLIWRRERSTQAKEFLAEFQRGRRQA